MIKGFAGIVTVALFSSQIGAAEINVKYGNMESKFGDTAMKGIGISGSAGDRREYGVMGDFNILVPDGKSWVDGGMVTIGVGPKFTITRGFSAAAMVGGSFQSINNTVPAAGYYYGGLFRVEPIRHLSLGFQAERHIMYPSKSTDAYGKQYTIETLSMSLGYAF